MSWQRVIRWVLLPVLTFVLGVAATTLWSRHSASKPKTVDISPPAESPILGLCELLDNPDKYTGQTVRVSAIMSGFIHGLFLYNPNCVTVNTRTAVFFNPGNKEQIQDALKQARGSDDWREAVDIVALGQFRKVTPSNQSDTIYDTAPLQFEIMRVEKASKVR
jgi:hypothetical protein